MKDKLIICNKIKTPDGTILESKHVHDCVTHVDKNGETYMVDGGHFYLRRMVNEIPYKELSVYSDDDIEKIRKHFKWGTYGKDGKSKFKYVKLNKMSNAHIKAILKQNVYENFHDIFQRELKYRKLNSIKILDK